MIVAVPTLGIVPTAVAQAVTVDPAPAMVRLATLAQKAGPVAPRAGVVAVQEGAAVLGVAETVLVDNFLDLFVEWAAKDRKRPTTPRGGRSIPRWTHRPCHSSKILRRNTSCSPR